MNFDKNNFKFIMIIRYKLFTYYFNYFIYK